MTDYLGEGQRKVGKDVEKHDGVDLDDSDVEMIRKHNEMPYNALVKQTSAQCQELLKEINYITGVKESDTGLAAPHFWDLIKDRSTIMNDSPLQVAQCTKIIKPENGQGQAKYIINIKQFAKFVVELAKKVSPTDIEEGMRVGVDRGKYQIHTPLPPKIDATVTMMQVEEKPDVSYSDV